MKRLAPGALVIATHNQGKLSEFKSLLEPRGFSLTSNADHDLPEPEETEDSFSGNALIKARAACDALGVPALADDSGMSIDVLGGAPGVYSADWAETESGRDFDLAMRRVRHELDRSGAEAPFTAAFHSVLALVWPDGSSRIFAGRCDGQIIWPARGANGHGYDPIFQPAGSELTFAEMSAAQKNAISHRSKAVDAFLTDGLE